MTRTRWLMSQAIEAERESRLRAEQDGPMNRDRGAELGRLERELEAERRACEHELDGLTQRLVEERAAIIADALAAARQEHDALAHLEEPFVAGRARGGGR